MHLAIITPVYNDWESFRHLASAIDTVITPHDLTATIVAVDDCSMEIRPDLEPLLADCEAVTTIEVMRLVRNMGHQKAIAIGLSYAHDQLDCDGVVVLDADGEDRPRDIARLVAAATETGAPIVVAQRGSRTESLAFRIMYSFYKFLIRLFSGQSIDFGNFSFLRPEALAMLVQMYELWTHFPGTLLRSKLPIHKVEVDRGHRFVGRSKMSLVGLVVHGMQGAAVFKDIILVRVAGMVIGLFVVLGVPLVAVLAYATDLGGNWQKWVAAGAFIILAQVTVTSVTALLTILGGDPRVQMRPIAHYRPLIGDIFDVPDTRPHPISNEQGRPSVVG